MKDGSKTEKDSKLGRGSGKEERKINKHVDTAHATDHMAKTSHDSFFVVATYLQPVHCRQICIFSGIHQIGSEVHHSPNLDLPNPPPCNQL